MRTMSQAGADRDSDPDIIALGRHEIGQTLCDGGCGGGRAPKITGVDQSAQPVVETFGRPVVFAPTHHQPGGRGSEIDQLMATVEVPTGATRQRSRRKGLMMPEIDGDAAHEQRR